MYTIPEVEPKVVTAGETWHWTIDCEDFPPAEGWTLTYYFAGPPGSTLTIVATTGVPGEANGDYDVLATPAQTATLQPGRYRWQAFAALASGETHVARPVPADAYAPAGTDEMFGATTVLPNIQAIAAGTFQTHNEKTLAAIETEIYNRINNLNSIESYVVAGRQISKIKILDLHRLRTFYQAAVHRERNLGKLGTTIGVHFGIPY